MHILSNPIDYLKGVGPARADLLRKELKIFTYGDLLMHYPFRYIDKTRIYNISELHSVNEFIQLRGKIISFNEKGERRKKRLTAILQDDTGQIELIWFKGIRWIKSSLKLNTEYIVFGKPSLYNQDINIAHPELDLYEEKSFTVGMQPVYHLTDKLSSRGITNRTLVKLIKTLLPLLSNHIEETLSLELISKLNLPSKQESLFNIHQPKDAKVLSRAIKRLKFEELFFLQLHLIKNKLFRRNKNYGYRLEKIGDFFNTFYHNALEFELTNAQKRVVREIRKDVSSSKQMNRLLQGDVGSGKTLVALLSMLMAVDNNYQTCLMAPTEILANQHFNTISAFLSKQDINVGLLTGSTTKKNRLLLHNKLKNGELNIIIGTHALLEEEVQFDNLALVVIDEQHRFGVAQRSKLWKKNKFPPHILVMTATPIPRTLSMTLYGDLDISIIDELPKGRKAVKTIWRTDSSRLQVIRFIREQIAIGRQIYIVFPLINESEKLDHKDLIEGYESIQREFPMPDFQVSVVHGKMKNEDKEYEMRRFVKGVTDIMIATTVIEVGVDVPNATVMIIESAERFGLSQLHQLRGRVGRGGEQSYCILMSGHQLSNEAKKRLSTMVENTDGFKISEIDLELRGPGDIMSTKQSGILDFKIANIATDQKILDFARKEAELLLMNDIDLEKEENINIVRAYRPYARERTQWSKIS